MLYQELGLSVEERYSHYQKLFDTLTLLPEQENKIEAATLRGEVYGGEQFHYKVSQLISRTTKLTSHGGDRKSEEYKGL